MADDERSEARHLALWQALSSSPFAFDFYEALRRIECALPKRPRIGEARRVQEDAVRFGQEPSLAFATSTLAAFIPGDPSRAPRLTQNFFGLMGPNGPLPLHLTEFARDRLRNHGDSTFVRFLDVFHHRLISLFYRTWARAQPTVNLDRGESDRFSLYVGALIGLASQSTRGRDSVPDASKLSFAGLLGRQSRNAEGIESILRNFFRVPVKVEPFSAHWMMVPEELYTRLGRSDGALLGQTTVIGAKVWDLQSKFRIVIGALNLVQYERFLPAQASYKRLTDWIRNYTGFELKWDCRLVLKQAEVPPLVLGYTGKLGWTTWLGTRRSDTDADDLVLAGH
jgi:type VI secretion system protein ImpH